MPNLSSKILIMMGRVLLALYFLLPGLAKLVMPELQLDMMRHHHVPSPEVLLPIAGLAQCLGSVLLLSGRYIRFVSFGFVIYILIVNLTLHDFWFFDGLEAAHELQNFIKNLGILAGLLILAGISPKRKLSLGGLKQADRKIG